MEGKSKDPLEDLKEEIPDVRVSKRTREVLERAKKQPSAGSLAELVERYL